jgi:probable rRNA maturation factor
MPDPASVLVFQHPLRNIVRAPLRRFLGDITAKIAGGRDIICLITDDAHLRALNRQFRGQDYPTDVLSFPGAGAGTGVGAGGELAISLDAAVRQAAELGHSVEDELRILILHGVLHLTGMDHETDSGQMARAETAWRKRLGLPPGLIERGLIERDKMPLRRKKVTA